MQYEQNQNLNENKIIWYVKLALTLQMYSNISTNNVALYSYYCIVCLCLT